MNTAPNRLMSLDALRGFDMFWIIGGAGLLSAIAERVHSRKFTLISDFFCEHVEWEGFHFHDMIFPLFLFIIGVSLPYSLGRRKEEGASRGQLLLKVVRRTVIMFLLGWVYSGFLEFKPFGEFRVMGVLQRLALGYGLAGLAVLFLGMRGRIAVIVSCLVGYWLAMRFIPVPGEHGGPWSAQGNLANYIDRVLFAPGQLYQSYGDPEGIFSTIPAVATALIGVLTGEWLRSARAPMTKVWGMAGAGIACIALGYLWGLDMPVIKKIWTSSYTLVAAGWSLLLLALFYWAIDVRGWKAWSFFFVVIGVNAITIYMGQRMIDFEHTAEFLFGGFARLSGVNAAIGLAAGVLLIKWLLLAFLHAKRVYLRL